MRASVYRRLTPLVDAQLGVVTAAQLREAGIDHELPRREGWTRLAHGLWVATDAPSDEQLLVGLDLYAPGSLASGALACRWWGIRHAADLPGVDALVEHGTTLLGGPLVRLRQSRHLLDGVEHKGRTVAPTLRAIADAARWSPWLQDARAVVLAALADRRIDRVELGQEADRCPARRSTDLLRALDDWDRGARSAPEAEAADALLALAGAGPQSFLLNPEVWVDGVLLGAPDGLVVDAGLAWEMDSVEFHGSSSSLDATLQRHQRFSDAGFELLHATPTRMRAARNAWAADVANRAASRMGTWRPPAGFVVVPKGPLLGAQHGSAV